MTGDGALVSVTESAGLLPLNSDVVRLFDLLDDGDQPADAVRLAVGIAGRIDRALTLAVRQARASGLTWEQIGDLLGVTKQAAHLRFSKVV